MTDKRLQAANELLRAAHAFWKIERESGMPSAVKWITGDDGSMVIFTRGEYRDQLMRNITELPGEGVYRFTKEET